MASLKDCVKGGEVFGESSSGSASDFLGARGEDLDAPQIHSYYINRSPEVHSSERATSIARAEIQIQNGVQLFSPESNLKKIPIIRKLSGEL